MFVHHWTYLHYVALSIPEVTGSSLGWDGVITLATETKAGMIAGPETSS